MTSVNRSCNALNCETPFYSKGKCKMHYNQLPHVKHLKQKSRENNKKNCKISGCTRLYGSLGYCNKHYRELPEVKERENTRRRNNPRQAQLRKKYLKERKFLVLNHYSKGKMCCACCGEKTFEFLTINHINGGGLRHNRELKAIGTTLYPFLKKNGFPEGYNVLCMNCNFADGHYGICPHLEL